MTIEVICYETSIRSTGKGMHRTVQIVLSLDKKYCDFLKDLFLIKHGGQRTMVE